MFKSKTTPITLELTGHKLRFDSPVNFSKEFISTLKSHYKINLYDQNLYKMLSNDVNNYHPIGDLSWDYSKNIFGFLKGTMSMILNLYQVSNKQLNINTDKVFLSVLQSHFEEVYSEVKRKKYAVDLPKQYEIKTFGNNRWGYYEYLVKRHHIHMYYSIRITDQHYIGIHFKFYNNGRHDISVWKPKALAAMETMLATFEVS